MTGTTSQGGKPPGNPPRQLHITHRASSCAKRGGHVQLCSKPRGARGIEPETFRRRGQLLSRPPTTGPMCQGDIRPRAAAGSSRNGTTQAVPATMGIRLVGNLPLDHATYGPALQLLASDPCEVVFFCGPHTRTATVKHSSRGDCGTRGDWKCYISSRSAMRSSVPCALVCILQLRSRLWSPATNRGLIGWPPQWPPQWWTYVA